MFVTIKHDKMSEANQEVVVETTETTEKPAAEAAVVETPYYAQFGEFSTEDDFKSWVSQAKEVVSTKDQIELSKADYESKLAILNQIDEEPDAEIVTLQAFKKQGIGIDIATKVVSFDPEKNDNPLQTLILAEAVSNPNKFNKLGYSGIEAAIREKYNLSEEGEYTPTALMKSDSIDAIDKINKVKSDIASFKNPITFAKEQLQQRSESFEVGRKAAAQEFEKIVQNMTEITDTHGEKQFTFKVTKEEQQVLMNLKDQVASQFPATKEGAEQMRQYVNNYARIQKYMSGEVYKEWESSLAADVEQKVTKEVLNGQALTPNRSGNPPVKGEDSPILREARRQGLAT